MFTFYIITVENDIDEEYDLHNGTHKPPSQNSGNTYIVEEDTANVSKDMGKNIL